MFNREQGGSTIRLYADGFGYQGYSMRLSNFSLKNIPINSVRLLSCVVGLGYAIVEASFKFTSSDGKTTYLLDDDNTNLARCANTDFDLKKTFMKGVCDTVLKSNDNKVVSWQDVVFCYPPDNRYTIFSPLVNTVLLYRQECSPIQEITEKCLKKTIQSIYVNCQALISKQEEQEASEWADATRNKISESAPYLVFGLFGVGAVGLLAYRAGQRRAQEEEQKQHVNYGSFLNQP